jgi:hypothetical protein
MVSGGLITGAVIVPKWTFAYTGSVQEVKFATTGTYEIELEGASGGHTVTTAATSNTAVGGKGGHVLGRYHFGGNVQSPVHLDIRVGGEGAGTAMYEDGTFTKITGDQYFDSIKAGGYNDGGTGGMGKEIGAPAGSGGGGATDVRPHGNSDPLTGSTFDDPRIIVAGGGGGAAQIANSHSAAGNGYGDAGGLEGNTGYGQSAGPVTTYIYPAGGAQSDGNAGGTGGIGLSFSTGNLAWEGSGGGGAGWWGGKANGNSVYAASGGGGSSYNGGTTAYPEGGGSNPVLTTPYDPSSPVYVPGSAANNATIAGNVYGNGKATIRWISPGN